MATVIITSSSAKNARLYVEAMKSAGATVRILIPEDHAHLSTEELMLDAGGLLLSGGPDIDPALYGEERDFDAGLNLNRLLDDLELRVLEWALERDMPVLAICRGMQLLNVAFGGQLIQDLPGHQEEHADEEPTPSQHLMYLAPGAKAAAVIGSAGFFRVNSLHHQGLREAQRSPQLMSTAYSIDDGLIEELESPQHSWVIGLQCHPERQDEVPKSFSNLFAAFLDRAEMYLAKWPR